MKTSEPIKTCENSKLVLFEFACDFRSVVLLAFCALCMRTLSAASAKDEQGDGEISVSFDLVTESQYRKMFKEAPNSRHNVNRSLTAEEVAEIAKEVETRTEDEWCDDNPPDIRDFGFTGNETHDPDLMDPRGIAFDMELISRAEKRFPGFPNVQEPKQGNVGWCTYTNGKAALHRQALRDKVRVDRKREQEKWETRVANVVAGRETDEAISFFWLYESNYLVGVKQCLKSGQVMEARQRYLALQSKVRSFDGDAAKFVSRNSSGAVSSELAKRAKDILEGKPESRITVKTKKGKTTLDRYLLDGISAEEYHSRVKIKVAR